VSISNFSEHVQIHEFFKSMNVSKKIEHCFTNP
jgi:hypothetical protein